MKLVKNSHNVNILTRLSLTFSHVNFHLDEASEYSHNVNILTRLSLTFSQNTPVTFTKDHPNLPTSPTAPSCMS